MNLKEGVNDELEVIERHTKKEEREAYDRTSDRETDGNKNVVESLGGIFELSR